MSCVYSLEINYYYYWGEMGWKHSTRYYGGKHLGQKRFDTVKEMVEKVTENMAKD